MMFKRIDHVEILPSDFERTMQFYQEILQFRFVSRKAVQAGPLTEIAYLQLGDTVVEMLHVENPATMPAVMTVGYRSMALEVASMAKAVTYLQEHGVAVTWGPMDLGDCIRAEIADPDGLTIELREWKERVW
jgi:catechol 2,3-dioxygenase-like lactoylglutathione lyase family enzyme